MALLQIIPWTSPVWLFFFFAAVVAVLSPSVLRSASCPEALHRAIRFVMGQRDALSKLRPVSPATESRSEVIDVEDGELGELKLLYHKLHHQEKYPEMLPGARNTLLRLLSESLQVASSKTSDNILDLKEYSRDGLTKYINDAHDHLGERWDAYVAGRQNGAPRDMYQDREAAIQWLKDHAAVKLVDGAWLGHIHRFSSAFSTRSITKNAWQIMSEELGDGDVAKNHTFLYNELLQKIGVNLPNADDKDFIHPRHNMAHLGGWRAAVSQLLISLFPNEFLPEILGFNMHFELLTWDTLCATKELRELKIDPYYFLLHVSIDNADSGHTAMATNIVQDYMEYIERTEGSEAARRVWKRVQAGYVLSESVGDAKKETAPAATNINIWNPYAERTAQLIQSKAMVSSKLHCTSRARIGGRTLVDWLDAQAMKSDAWARDFLEALSKSKAWVVPGKSSRSRLVQTLSWEGKMFGAFSEKELQTLCLWIDNMVTSSAAEEQRTYYEFTTRNDTLPSLDVTQQNILVDYPVMDESLKPSLARWVGAYSGSTTVATARLRIEGAADFDKLMPLWFAQASLVEGMITIPIKTCDAGVSALIRVVRAQRGFLDCGDGCAGMDEVSRPSATGLHELGLAMMARAGLATPADLRAIFTTSRDTAAALRMLHLSMRPIEYGPALVGMSWAFARLHHVLAESGSAVLPASQLEELSDMAKVECRYLQEYMNGMTSNAAKKAWSQGFEAAKREIERCFH